MGVLGEQKKEVDKRPQKENKIKKIRKVMIMYHEKFTRTKTLTNKNEEEAEKYNTKKDIIS